MGRIMVVDDEPDLLRLMEKILSKRGHEVIPVSSGRECLERVKTEKPDLILLDVMMPDIDGWEVSKTLKDSLETRDIPVVILTVRTSDASMERGFKFARCDAYLKKPIVLEKLFGTIEEFIGRS